MAPPSSSPSMALPIITNIVFRIISFVFLLASFIIVRNNSLKATVRYIGFNFSAKNTHAYKYAACLSLIGKIYALLHLPFSIYQLCRTSRHMGVFLLFSTYADKDGSSDFHELCCKFDQFSKKGNVGASLLFIEFLCVTASSTLSSVYLEKKKIVPTNPFFDTTTTATSGGN